MSLTTKNPGNISRRKVDERRQATPTGIPIASVIAFGVITIFTGNDLIPLGLIALNVRLILSLGLFRLGLLLVSLLLLIFAELLSQPRWRSMLFSLGSIFLVVEWLFVMRLLAHVPWITFLTSLPFLVFIMFWNARSLGFLFKLDKRWTSLP